MRLPNQSAGVVNTVSASRLTAGVMPQRLLRQRLIGTGRLNATCGDVSGECCWQTSNGTCVCSDGICFPPEIIVARP